MRTGPTNFQFQEWCHLLKLVERVDEEAACWMREELPAAGIEFDYFHNLDEAFCWADTPQGTSYWNRIYNAVEELLRQEGRGR